MPHKPAAVVRALTLLTAVALALTVSGCTDEPAATAPSTPDSAAPTPAEPTSTTPSPTPEPPTGSTESPATDSPATDSPATDSPATGPAGLPARLLPAAELPGFNESFAWREQATSAREPADLATCDRFAVSSVGATRTVTRTYVPAGQAGRPARHLVAQFPDAATAARAYDVLGAWHRRCRERLARYDLRRVGALQPVAVPAGAAGWYLLTYGPVQPGSDDAVFESTGLAIAGDRVAILDMRLEGQDFNYAPGEEPMVTAAQRAAALLQ